MVKRLPRFRSGVVAAAVIAIGMFLVPTSGTAFAAQAAPGSAAAQTAFAGYATTATAQTYITLTVVNASGVSFSEWVCSSGLHDLGVDQGDVVNADNGCNGRLWLHRLDNGGGNSYCINPHTDVQIPAADEATQSITASANTAKCLS